MSRFSGKREGPALTPDIISYLAPILRSVGISEPIKITLINSGLGKLAVYRVVTAPSLTQRR